MQAMIPIALRNVCSSFRSNEQWLIKVFVYCRSVFLGCVFFMRLTLTKFKGTTIRSPNWRIRYVERPSRDDGFDSGRTIEVTHKARRRCWNSLGCVLGCELSGERGEMSGGNNGFLWVRSRRFCEVSFRFYFLGVNFVGVRQDLPTLLFEIVRFDQSSLTGVKNWSSFAGRSDSSIESKIVQISASFLRSSITFFLISLLASSPSFFRISC